MKKSTPKKVIKKKASAFKAKPLDMSSLHTNDDVKRYIGFVTENFQGQVSAVAEQFIGLNGRFDILEDKIDSLEGRMTGVEMRLGKVEKTIDEHTEILNAHTKMYGRLMMSNEEIKAGLSQKADKEEVHKLGMRVATLELLVYSGKNKK